MAVEKAFFCSSGPYSYNTADDHASSGFPLLNHAAVDGDSGRIGALLGITIVLGGDGAGLSYADDACSFFGDDNDFCLTFDSAADELELRQGDTICMSVDKSFDVDIPNGTLTLGTQLAVAQGGTGATSLDDIVGTGNQIDVDAGGANAIIGGNATLTLSATLVTPGSLDVGSTFDVTGAATLDSTLAVTGDVHFLADLDVDVDLNVDGDTVLDGTLSVDTTQAYGDVQFRAGWRSKVFGVGRHDDGYTSPYMSFGCYATADGGEVWDAIDSYHGGVIMFRPSTTDSVSRFKFGFVDYSTDAETTAMSIAKTGDVVIANDLDVTGDFTSAQGDLILTTSNAPDATDSAGIVGTITWEDGFLYVCRATNDWQRVAIATF